MPSLSVILVGSLGNDPSSSDFQSDANPSQLATHSNFSTSHFLVVKHHYKLEQMRRIELPYAGLQSAT